MCLDKLLKDVEITETVGYKVFDVCDGKLVTAIMYFEVVQYVYVQSKLHFGYRNGV